MKQVYDIKLITEQRSGVDSKIITFQEEGILDFLSRTNNVQLLERYFQNTDGTLPLPKLDRTAFRLSVQHNFENFQEEIIGKGMHSKSQLLHCLALTDDWIIYCNKPTLLDTILTSSKALLDDEAYALLLGHFFQVYELLQRTECLQVVLKHGYILEQTAVTASDRAEKLVQLLLFSKPVLKDTIV